MIANPIHILQQYWQYSAFRGEQEAIIQSITSRKDTLALLPTGGGKSICFQVPAMMMEGCCLVISPLIALMKDQVANLAKRGIPAIALHSGMSYYEVNRSLQQCAAGEFKLIYISPERLQTTLFQSFLPALEVSMIAVDEAHCISQWGYDFRPSYLRIADLRSELPGVPVLALTASATPMVQEDIIRRLQMKNCAVFRQSFARPNLSYSAFKVHSKINKVVTVLQKVGGSGIVYCNSRRQTQQVAELLQLQHIAASFYHAGLSAAERSSRQDHWMQGRTRVMVCTNAFGMGIDKPDVRTVVHYGVPDCLENYYQEAGRAGRDGRRSFAVAVYDSEDLHDLEMMPEKKFPPFATIQQIYQSIADYLNIPIGLGEGNYYNFDLRVFATNFRYDLHVVMNTLKALEGAGHLAFNEDIFLPPQVNFTAPKEQLEDFEASHPSLEPLVKVLLRTYEGIYDNRVSVNEKQIARLAHMPVEQVQEQLRQLQSFGIIEYLPQKETPQIYFLLNRAPAQYLHFDHAAYLERKRLYAEKVQALQQYLQTDACRSQYIANYFGEAQSACGVCDNCLRRKAGSGVSAAEFHQIATHIYPHIPDEGITIQELVERVSGIKKEQLWQVLAFLQTENALMVKDDKLFRVSAGE